MARSSGRRTTKKRRKGPGRGSRSRRGQARIGLLQAILWFLGGIGLGLLILLPFYLLGGDGERETRPAEPQREAPSPDQPPEPEDVPPPQPQTDPAPSPEERSDREEEGYRFYTLLPQMEVEVSEHPPGDQPAEGDTEPPAQDTRRPDPAGGSGNGVAETPRPDDAGDFLVQVASFREAEAAESLKARLALRDFRARVVQADLASRGTWYRVRLGPYAGRSAAETVRSRLAAEGIDALVLRP
ncbi:hypothetical protein AN478_09635 [Thiohalorhabdus denitrificans]|uniref:Sporulation related domain-containing protein n=1 Tax=Thiohalorhabdus denitrificans TaxID=381306 RepID=A0A0P9GHD6_9GAMM|nr:SPOR domain-containing protein [Thiohalorhabdus denitrificans]KPV39427.1 hypothetical protein AN478_09635 [Thiohalorhabdus denitrificans]SCY03497.1 Sporulation related domain-containing protein [Thiohalorhabdus denitrificans]